MLLDLARRLRMTTIKPYGRGADVAVRLSLRDRSPDVARALGEAFAGAAGVEVLAGDLMGPDADAVVSPANSFGYMDGGVDHHIDRFYAGEAQRRVLARIAERHYGELPVGSAAVVAMGTRRFPLLVVAPTMRVPGDDLGATIHAYLAMRAALAAVLDHNLAGVDPIRTLAVPGLGTGVGGMDPAESARQMRAAVDMILGGGYRAIQHPAEAPFVLRRPAPR